MDWGGSERRMFPRANFSCRLIISDSKDTIESMTENIGAGGIRVILGKQLTRDTQVNMEIFTEPQKTIKCLGYVAWIVIKDDSPRGVVYDTGIKFYNFHESDIIYMRDLVERINLGKKQSVSQAGQA